jgi:hypothetical protein
MFCLSELYIAGWPGNKNQNSGQDKRMIEEIDQFPDYRFVEADGLQFVIN